MEARNYLLGLFKDQKYVDRNEFCSNTSLPGPLSFELFSEIASLHQGKGWTLKLEPDLDFESQYPDLVSQHADKLSKLCVDSLKALQVSPVVAPTKKEQPLKIVSNTAVDLVTLPVKGATAHDQMKNLVETILTTQGALNKTSIFLLFNHHKGIYQANKARKPNSIKRRKS